MGLWFCGCAASALVCGARFTVLHLGDNCRALTVTNYCLLSLRESVLIIFRILNNYLHFWGSFLICLQLIFYLIQCDLFYIVCFDLPFLSRGGWVLEVNLVCCFRDLAEDWTSPLERVERQFRQRIDLNECAWVFSHLLQLVLKCSIFSPLALHSQNI